MSWSKLKQQLEGFLSPALNYRVEYRAQGYCIYPINQGFVKNWLERFVGILKVRDVI